MAPVKRRSSPRIKSKPGTAKASDVSPLTLEQNSVPKCAGKNVNQDIIIKKFPSLTIKKKGLTTPKTNNFIDILSQTNDCFGESALAKVVKSPSLKAADIKSLVQNKNIKRKNGVPTLKSSPVKILPQSRDSINENSLTMTAIKSPLSLKAADVKTFTSNKNVKRRNSAVTSKFGEILPQSNGQLNQSSPMMTIIKLSPTVKMDTEVLVPEKMKNYETILKNLTAAEVLPQDRLKKNTLTMTLIKAPSSSKAIYVRTLTLDKNLKRRNSEMTSKNTNSVKSLTQSNNKGSGGSLVMKPESSPDLKPASVKGFTSDKNVKKKNNASKHTKSVYILPKSNNYFNGNSITIDSSRSLTVANVKVLTPNKNVKDQTTITTITRKINSPSAKKTNKKSQHSKSVALKNNGKYIPMKLQKVMKKSAKASEIKFKVSESCKKKIEVLKIPSVKLSKLQELKTMTVSSLPKTKFSSPVSKDNSLNLCKEPARRSFPKAQGPTHKPEQTLINMLTSQGTSSCSLASKTDIGSHSRKKSSQQRSALTLNHPTSSKSELPTIYFLAPESTSSSLASRVTKTYSKFLNSCTKPAEQKLLQKAKEPTDNPESSLVRLLTLDGTSSSCQFISQLNSHYELPIFDGSLRKPLQINNPLSAMEKCIPDNLLRNTELSIQLSSQEPSLSDLLKNENSSVLRERKNEANSVTNRPLDDMAGSSSEVPIITLSSDESSVEDEVYKKRDSETVIKSNGKLFLSSKQLVPKILKLNDENSVPANSCKSGITNSETFECKCATNRCGKIMQTTFHSVISEKKNSTTVPVSNVIAEINDKIQRARKKDAKLHKLKKEEAKLKKSKKREAKLKKKAKKLKRKLKKKLLDIDSADPDFEMVDINLFFTSGEFRIPSISCLMQNTS